MGIQFACTRCGSGFSVGGADAGRLCKCSSCGKVMRVPGNAEFESESALAAALERGERGESEGAGGLSGTSSGRSGATGGASVASSTSISDPGIDTSSDTGSATRPRMRLSGRAKGGIVVVVISLALFTMGYKEMRLLAASAETPQRMTCRELAERGPGANAYVVLTDFMVGRNICWYKSDTSHSEWDMVWLPLLPIDGPITRVSMTGATEGGMEANSSGIQVLLKSTTRRNQDDVLTLFMNNEISGTVVNCIASVGPKPLAVLRSAYPDTDFSQCWILEEGRKPSSKKCVAYFVTGGLTLLLSFGFFRKRSEA